MPEAACKSVDCCDLDDFPQSSSAEGNCPVGWQWDGTSCVRCAIPAAPSLSLAGGGGVVDLTFDVDEGLSYSIERFSDGHWGEMIEKGYIRRILERLQTCEADHP